MDIQPVILVLQLALATPSLFSVFRYLARRKERRVPLRAHEDADGAATGDSIRAFKAARGGITIWVGITFGMASTVLASPLGYTGASHGYTLSWVRPSRRHETWARLTHSGPDTPCHPFYGSIHPLQRLTGCDKL
ncbi:hypothetical protein IMZ48_41525 [Candidatus Bathyarchaeota archaeon]|nr:hypothetical protein [Candidatus Bathyarchaeota archaeon]